jgi:2,3-bisphosphoglycerate-independent phosphoglycerate mutase
MEMNESTNLEIKRPKPVVLIVMDGWGIAQPYSGNAVSQANTPAINELIARYPSTTLRASGEAVGLPWGESGNSEVGHLNLGLGRIVYQDLPRINRAIADGSFYQNMALLHATEHTKKSNSNLHLMGLVSNGGVHASIDHMFALLALAKDQGLEKVFIHAFLDGRDTQYNSALNFIKEVERSIAEYGVGKIATLSGRFYAMDRDNHWERISKSYLAMVRGEGNKSEDAVKAIEDSYEKKIYDEEFVPTVITQSGNPTALFGENDSVIFFNYLPDRARQITKVFTVPGFLKFEGAEYMKNLLFVSFTEYENDLPVEIAFPPEPIVNTLGEILSKAGLRQLRIAETEKYAHVTYFFNGGKEEKSEKEEHVLVPSPRVDSYDMKPEMSALEVTDKICSSINDETYDFILVNYANADMVGHTGNMKATMKAVEVVDKCIDRVVKAALKKDGVVLITADHGNAEGMFNMQSGIIDKEHSANPVPFLIIGKEYEGKVIGRRDAMGGDLSLVQPQGILSDIAPTILKIINIHKPPEMTGRPLI